MKTDAVVELKEVNKWYGEFHVLRNINLQVGRGEKIVICGPSGSGKSTMIRCINRLEEHQSGDILVKGTALTSDLKNIETVRREVGMVFQHFNLFPHLTVLENCCLAPIWVKQLPRKEAEEIAMNFLRRVRIPEQALKYPGQLSGGQQQRVAIARALVCKPRLMLLDEPFSNIDTQVRMKLILEIRTLLKQQGIGAIFVSHSKEEAFAFADRLALFRAGRIEQVGEPEQLYRRPGNRFVAEFLGGVNYLAAEVVDSHCVQTLLGTICGQEPHGRAVGERLQLMLRPQQLALTAADDGELRVREQQFLGHHCRVLVECGGQQLEASIGEPLEGERARVTVAPHALVLFDPLP